MPHSGKGIYGQYDQDNLKKALDAVRNGQMSVRKAASSFKVPKSTIGDRISGRKPDPLQLGSKPVIPAEIEKSIADRAMDLAAQGFGIGRRQLIARTATVCKDLKLQTPFKNGIPGKDWWDGFKRRNPTVVLRRPEKLSTVRSRMLNAVTVGNYMKELKGFSNLNPTSIWNMDETGINMEHQPTRVVARQGSKSVPGRVSNSRENITFLPCVNAAGEKMSPFIVVKGKTPRSLRSYNMHEGPSGSVWRFQQKAWMDDSLGLDWFKNVFLQECGEDRPQVLILDSHHSHETLSLLEEAAKNEIHVLAIPPHTTHYLCPLDRCVFGPFMKEYNKVCTEYMSAKPDNMINKESVPALISNAYSKAFTRTNIVSGFEATGIFHWNPLAIPKDAFMPSAAFDKEKNQTPVAESDHPLDWVLQECCSSDMSTIPLDASIDSVTTTPPVTSATISRISATAVTSITSGNEPIAFPYVATPDDMSIAFPALTTSPSGPTAANDVTMIPLVSTTTPASSLAASNPIPSSNSTISTEAPVPSMPNPVLPTAPNVFTDIPSSPPSQKLISLVSDVTSDPCSFPTTLDSPVSATDPMVSGQISDMDAATILAGLVDGGIELESSETVVSPTIDWSSNWNSELDQIFSLPASYVVGYNPHPAGVLSSASYMFC